MKNRIAYFAFGSNLDLFQMRRRCPHAVLETRATLPNHRLVFAGFSKGWGSPVATVVRDRSSSVPGVIYTLSHDDVRALDRFEGAPDVYRRVERIVIDAAGRRRRVQVYELASTRLTCRMPKLAYFYTIRRAYQRHGFDERILTDAALWEIE